MTIPYLPGQVLTYLESDPQLRTYLHGGTLSCREVPDPLGKPHVTVKMVGNQGSDPMLRRVLLQITPWIPARATSGINEDPDVTAWNIAMRAGELLAKAKNIHIPGDDRHAWSATWIDGPVQLEETTRGKDRPIYYAPIRVAVHLRRRVPTSRKDTQ